MYFDLFLISVVLVTLYLGPMIILRHPPGERGFGWLLVADGLCAIIALAGRWQGAPESVEMIGFIAIAAGVFLLVIPPILRDVTRRTMTRGRLHLAHRLLGIRELLQPGMGAAHERDLLESIIAVRSGRVDDAVSALRDTREAVDSDEARRDVDERILLTYLSARRWRDATEIYERTFDPTTVSAQLSVEVVRAYCELGEREKACELMQILENSPLATEPLAVLLIGRARLVFLAFAGRIREVDKLLAEDAPMSVLPPASQQFWSGIARLHAGDRPGARERLQAAHDASAQDPQAHAYTERVLASIDEPGVAGPHTLPAAVTELADLMTERVATMKPLPKRRTPQLSGIGMRQVPVTAVMLIINVIAFALMMWHFGSTGDPGALVLSGANVKSAVAAGEWWRLCTCMFIHAGFLHLLLNGYGLWVLGKLVEQIYGSTRSLVLYVGTGIAGALASLVFSGPTMSVGASGAVLGLLGALIAELTLARKAYPERWRKTLLGNFLFIAAAMIGIGLFYGAIDHAAHVGGMVAGLVLGALLSPHSPVSAASPVRGAARILAALSGVILAYSAVALIGSDYADTLSRYGQVEHRTQNGVAFVVPSTWREDGPNGLIDPYVITTLDIEVSDVSDIDSDDETDVGALLEAWRSGAERGNPGAKRRPAHARMELPDPWQSRELVLSEDGEGGAQHFRMMLFGRRTDEQVWLGKLVFPDRLADAMRPTIERILTSMRPL